MFFALQCLSAELGRMLCVMAVTAGWCCLDIFSEVPKPAVILFFVSMTFVVIVFLLAGAKNADNKTLPEMFGWKGRLLQALTLSLFTALSVLEHISAI